MDNSGLLYPVMFQDQFVFSLSPRTFETSCFPDLVSDINFEISIIFKTSNVIILPLYELSIEDSFFSSVSLLKI